jgi:hypothetical protein
MTMVENQLKTDLVRSALDTASDHGANTATLVTLASDLCKKLGGKAYWVGLDLCPICLAPTVEGEDFDVVFTYPCWASANAAEAPSGTIPVLIIGGLVHHACAEKFMAEGNDIARRVYDAALFAPDVDAFDWTVQKEDFDA